MGRHNNLRLLLLPPNKRRKNKTRKRPNSKNIPIPRARRRLLAHSPEKQPKMVHKPMESNRRIPKKKGRNGIRRRKTLPHLQSNTKTKRKI